MTQYNLVSQNSESTVVSEYKPDNVRQSAYQSEAELEKAFIRQLEQQAYEYVTIHSEADLISNLRKQLEKLNNYKFTDAEWEDFFRTYLANGAEGIVEKTKTIQEDYKKILKRGILCLVKPKKAAEKRKSPANAGQRIQILTPSFSAAA